MNQFTQPDTFTDVAWVGNCMLGASLDGQVYRYNLKPEKSSSPKDVSDVYSHSKLKASKTISVIRPAILICCFRVWHQVWHLPDEWDIVLVFNV